MANIGLVAGFCSLAPLFEIRRSQPCRASFVCCDRAAVVASNKSKARRQTENNSLTKPGRCITEVTVGDEFIGVVKFVGPAQSSWIDIGVCTKGGKEIVARLRFSQGRQRAEQGESVGSIIPVYVHRVQPESGRIEVRKGMRPVVKKVPDNPLMIHDVHVGDKFDGTVVSIGHYGAIIDANVYRVARRGRLVCHTGLLRRNNFKQDWASETDLVTPANVSRVLKTGDAITVWVRRVLAKSALLLFDANEVSAADLEAERMVYIRALRKRKRRQAISTIEKGERRVGNVTNIKKYGVFVNIGVKKDGLIHYTQMTEKHRTDWKEFEKGMELYVEVIDIIDDKIALALVGVKDEMLNEALDMVNSPTSRVEDVQGARGLIASLQNPRQRKSRQALQEEIVIRNSGEEEEEFVEGDEESEELEEIEKFSDEYFEDKYDL